MVKKTINIKRYLILKNNNVYTKILIFMLLVLYEVVTYNTISKLELKTNFTSVLNKLI